MLSPSIAHDFHREAARHAGSRTYSPAKRAQLHALYLGQARYYRRLASDRGLSFYRGDYIAFARNNLNAARAVREAAYVTGPLAHAVEDEREAA
jgi:hypothetical protein